MIRYIKRKDLDIEKYDRCIENAINSRIYAFSWYLDIVADNWDALVSDDYLAVMPLPWKSKFLIKHVYSALCSQQLGVFSATHIDADLVQSFLIAIPKKFKKVSIQLNSVNPIFSEAAKKVNYILPLDKSYDEIATHFNKNRKRELKKALVQKELVLNKKLRSSDFLSFFNHVKLPFELSGDAREKLNTLIGLKRENILIWGVTIDDDVLAAVLFLKDKERITYLLPLANDESKKKGIPTLLVAELIKEFSNTQYVLDFEGSMIEGIASFYRSFGAKEENYSVFSFDRIPVLLKRQSV